MKNILLIVLAVFGGVNAHAQTVNHPDNIPLSPGQSLEKSDASFAIYEEPLAQDTMTRQVIHPPVYENFWEDGVQKRRILYPERHVVVADNQPHRTKKTRKVLAPPFYIIRNQDGEIAKKWVWNNGNLTKVE